MCQIMGAAHRLNKDYVTPLLDARKVERAEDGSSLYGPGLSDYYKEGMLLSDHAQPGTAGLGARPDLPPGDSRSAIPADNTAHVPQVFVGRRGPGCIGRSKAGERLANSAVDVTENLQMAYRMLEQTGRDNAIRRVVAQRRKEFSSPDDVREKISLGRQEKSTVSL